MAHKRECFCLLVLFTHFFPSLADNAQVLMNFKGSLSSADALNNWGNQSIALCSWTGILCFNNKFHGLRLENMGLSGTIDVDALLQLSILNSFSVINNNFEGPLPAFKKLVSLRALFLSNNKFSGEIPDNAFDGMVRLKRVFLSENGFTGNIPASLVKLPKLLDVDIHRNSFTGSITEFQQRDFRVFNLSYNHLEGPIPQSLSNKDPSSFIGNEGLCGKPLNPCLGSPPSPSDQHANSSPGDEEKEENKKRVLLIIIVVVVVILLGAILGLVLIRQRRKKGVLIGDAETGNVNSVSSESKSIVASAEWKKSEEEGGLKFVRKEAEAFDLQELLRASAEVLGSGGFGSTYKAMLMNGSTVVVKRFKNMNSVGKKEFTEHMRRVGGLSHPNLVPLVAFYYGKEEKLLVHEFAENGSLASHLHGRGGCELDWGSRLKIIKGVARGLGYLYREFPEEEVVHGHLKSSNVMLDHSMEARLAEYGLGGVVEKRDAEQFMVAYKCPEGRSEKSDVWCLGILILEVVTGKFPANYLRAEKEDLTAWVKEVVDKWKWSGEGEMLKLLRIGIGCCEYSLESRWDWMEALAKIEDLKETDPDAHHFYLSSSISQDDFSLSLSLPTS